MYLISKLASNIISNKNFTIFLVFLYFFKDFLNSLSCFISSSLFVFEILENFLLNNCLYIDSKLNLSYFLLFQFVHSGNNHNYHQQNFLSL